MLRIGVDTGGTFTDFVIVRDGELRTWKEPSTPDDPARAILSGLRRILEGEPAAPEIVHGSTVATNALLEGKTAPIAFLTNRGFEDLLEIGRQARPDLYNLMAQRPPALAPRERRHGVSGRLGPDGGERRPVDPAEVRALAARLRSEGISTVAVCLLHSYANPAHEEDVARLLEQAGLTVSASCRLVPVHREFERASTTAVNAAVVPIMSRYLGRLTEGLAEGAGDRPPRLLVMGSNGGALSAVTAGREAVRTVLSGPAGGVRAAVHAGAEMGIANLISFDMGGTSTDVSLLPGGARTTSESIVAGHPIQVPTIDIHTVGAGGGSIGWRDPGGALRVGPASAGADPGPACYGRGGPATVTDAHLLLGRIVAERFLDGRMTLSARAALEAMTRLADSVGLGWEETAEGMLDVAEATMARAIRVITLFRGHEPADFALLAFGGAGGLHAASLADALGMRHVIVPARPGVFSAFGMTVADIVRDATATILRDVREVDPADASARFHAMEETLRAGLAKDVAGELDVAFERAADLRYAGQSFEINVPVLDTADPGAWAASFHAAHEKRYGYRRSDERVELVALRTTGAARVSTGAAASPPRGGSLADSLEGRRPLHWRGEWLEASLHERDRMPVGAGRHHGDGLAGPALVLESGATTFVPPGWLAHLDPAGHMHMMRGAAS
jgi:N-methylhydantoinase A